MQYPAHPYAEIFPLIEGEAFERFCCSLKEDGRLHDKIVLFEGQVLDGRNRQRACAATGIVAHYRTYDPDTEGDPLKYVIAKNLQRRHLDESQRALAAARIAKLKQGARTDISPIGEKSQAERAEIMNVGKRTVERADAVVETASPEIVKAVEEGRLAISAAAEAAKLSPEVQRTIADEALAGRPNVVRTIVKKAVREEKEKALGAAQLSAPEPIYGCILEDYEWDFEVYSRETGMDRHAGNHYPVSADAHTAGEIVKRTEERMKCAAPACVIGAWCTVPHLHIALEVMRLRGFAYKSSFVWVKDKAGTGYWNRNKHEIFLIGTRGNIPAPAMGTQFDSVIVAARGEHSVKPDWQYEFFERHFPHLPKIELNARRARPGWAAWGLEAPIKALATQPEGRP